MSKGITEEELRKIVRKVLQEKLAKKETEVVTETEEKAPEVTTEEKASNDEWYGNTLFESLKRKWTK